MSDTIHYPKCLENEQDEIVRSIQDVPVTKERIPYINTGGSDLEYAGTARANLAASAEVPQGTTQNGWAKQHSHQTVLQQHCDFFDRDHDSILWPQDTFIGFYRLGFGIILSLFSMILIHANFSYPTCHGWLPDPFFRIFLGNVHKDKHGSDTGTYDNEGRFVPQKFQEIFSKYAEGRDYLTIWDVSNVLKGQRCIADPIGWFGALFEWTATYILLWPKDGRLMKEDIRGIYDGSIFYTISARRRKCEQT